MNKEFIAKEKEANSVEELLALARKNNIELTEEQAQEYYDRLRTDGELADGELDVAAGGSSDYINSQQQSSTERLRRQGMLR